MQQVRLTPYRVGIIFDGDMESTYPQDYDYLVDINLRCAFHMTLLFQKYLEKTKGVIINVSCPMGHRPQSGVVGYCMTKAGLETMTKCLALELAPMGIRVNCVVPATMNTNLYRYAGVINEGDHKSFLNRVAGNIPLQRLAFVDEAAKAVIFLSSERAIRVTGHIMKVDGGKTLTSSGYIPWYGADIMSKRFEPDFFSKVNYWMSKAKDKTKRSKFEFGSEKWVAEIQTANWATHNEDAHFKVLQDYKKDEIDDEMLDYHIEGKKAGGHSNPQKAKRVA